MRSKNFVMRLFLLIIITLVSNSTLASPPSSFSKIKKVLYKKVYPNYGKTFYTNCDWRKKQVDLSSCGLQNSFPRKQMKRATRVEVEHVIPSSWFYKKNGNWRQCVIDAKRAGKKKRKYCRDNDKQFRKAHNDLINLRPTVGQINANRSNKAFAERLSGKKQSTFRGNGKLMQISSRVVVPDDSIKGDIARIGMFMSSRYDLKLSKRVINLYKKWNKLDPVSQEEWVLNKRIERAQGHGNTYVIQ